VLDPRACVLDRVRAGPTHIRAAHTIWVAAPGPANAAVLYGGADAPLTRSDRRLRPIPFPTARPTLAEATRTALRLSRVDYLSAAEATALLPPAAQSEEERLAESARVQARRSSLIAHYVLGVGGQAKVR